MSSANFNFVKIILISLATVYCTGALGVLGGQTVAATDILAKSTVQIFSFQKNRQHDQQDHLLLSAECTGTVLTESIIITAAHCARDHHGETWLYFSSEVPKNPTALVEAHFGNPHLRKVVGRLVTLDSTKPTVGNDSSTDWADVALYKFSGTLPPGIQTVSLLPLSERFGDEEILVAGFGIVNPQLKTKTKNLQRVALKALATKNTDSEFIVETSLEKGVCVGDSGGPAYVLRSGKLYLAGLVSHPELKPAPNTAFCSGRTKFTRLQNYIEWIRQSIPVLQTSSDSRILRR